MKIMQRGPVVIKAMYEVLDRLGYEKGNKLKDVLGNCL